MKNIKLMKTNILNLFILSTTVFGLLSCVDPCSVDFHIANSSSVEIQLCPDLQGNYFIDSTINIKPNSSSLFQIGYDHANYDSVPILVFIDSIKIIFDNNYAIMHYKDSSKGDYSHSIINVLCNFA